MLSQKILKSGVPDWLKMHLPYGKHCYIILYSLIHLYTIKMVTLIIAFLRSWCEFSSEFLLLSELLQFFSFWGEIFSGNSKNFLGPMVPWGMHICNVGMRDIVRVKL